jgi:hypothetical protein
MHRKLADVSHRAVEHIQRQFMILAARRSGDGITDPLRDRRQLRTNVFQNVIGAHHDGITAWIALVC